MAAAVPAIVGGTALFQAIEGRKARKRAESEADDAKRQSDQRNAEYQAKLEGERRKKAQLAMSTRSSLLSTARGSGNRGGTLLTGPAGLKSTLGS